MTVMTAYQVIIYCDYCGEKRVEDFVMQKGAIHRARLDGWSIGKTVKCPKCRKEGA